MKTMIDGWIGQIDDVDVRVEVSGLGTESHRVCVSFGSVPTHTSWFMDEAYLDILIKNLLDAQLKYIKEGKNAV